MAPELPDTAQAVHLDDLDSRLILELAEDPRVGVMELARRLGVARGTAQARLTRLLDSGAVKLRVDLDLARIGYPITAFTTLEISQGKIESVARRLEAIPGVLEVHTVAGTSDLLVRLVAQSTGDLFYTIEQALEMPEIERTSTAISLVEHIPRRIEPLVASRLGE